MLKNQEYRYDRCYMCGTTASRYYRSTWGDTTDFSGDHQNSARTKTKIGITFDPLGQSLRNLKRNFSKRLRTYSNQRLRRSTSKFQHFSIWTKFVSKPSQGSNLIQELARGKRMIKMILDRLPHVTASKINTRAQARINESSKTQNHQRERARTWTNSSLGNLLGLIRDR